MYCRVFSLRRFRIGAWVLGTIVCIYTVIFVFLILFQCTPVRKAWNPLVTGHCWNMRGTFIANAVPNILTDVAILTMPVHSVWKLQIRMVQRISLLGIFFLGCLSVPPTYSSRVIQTLFTDEVSSSVIIASIYRLVQVLQLDQNNLSCETSTIVAMNSPWLLFGMFNFSD